MIYSKYFWISVTEHDPSGNSSLSFQVGADILNLLLYDFYEQNVCHFYLFYLKDWLIVYEVKMFCHF